MRILRSGRIVRTMRRWFGTLKAWFTSPRFEDEERAVFSRIVGVLCLVVLAGVVIPIILSWTMGEPHAALALCLEGLCAALAFWLSRQGRPQAAAMLLS